MPETAIQLPYGKGCGLCCIGIVPDGFPFNPKTHTCNYYDAVTRTCSNYDNRPPMCRNFKCGGVDCNDIRKFYAKYGKTAADFLIEGKTLAVQKLATYSYPEYKIYGISIAVGWGIGKKETREQNRRFNEVREVVHAMGYALANDQYAHPPNMVGDFRLNISMGADFGVRDDDPYLVKLYNKSIGETL